MIWLLQESVRIAMETAPPLSATQMKQAMAAIGDPVGRADRVMSVSGSIATINITGVMTTVPSFIAYIFGGGNVLYGDLDTAIDAAEGNPAITNVDFIVNSGGGEAQPAVDLGDRIAAMTKPTRALVKTAGSAAYWAASQTDTIVALSRASRVGSIGAATIAAKPSESQTVTISSTNAPNKRPNPETQEGKAAIRAELDQVHDLFATAVAIGRDTTVERVNNTFGRGGMLLANKALVVGMIDVIGEHTKVSTKITGATTMDLATLVAEYPALIAQVQTAARKEGAAEEIDRVRFHALMGQKTGAIAFALQACLDGKRKNDIECQVEYMTFGRNNSDLNARGQDEQDLGDNHPALVDEKARETAAIANIFERVGV